MHIAKCEKHEKTFALNVDIFKIKEEHSRNIKNKGNVKVENSGNNSGIMSGINSGEIHR